MKPYYEENEITIYHGDAAELIGTLGAQVVLTDPPFGVGMKAFGDRFEDVAALNQGPGTLAAVFMTPRRVVQLANVLTTWKFQRLLTMHKTADQAVPWRGWCMNSESILILSRDGAEWPEPETYRSDVYTVGPWRRTGKHPNEKPLDVVMDLMMRLSKPGATILDPFMGSGTTLRAAKDLGRRAIGIEKEERYCELAANRLRQQVFREMTGRGRQEALCFEAG